MGQNVEFDVIARDKASSTFSKVGKSAKSSTSAISKFGSSMKLLGGLALGGGVVSFLKSANDEAREAQKVGAQTTAVIKSTGGAAKLSAKQFGDLATKISLKTGIDDEAIQSGENMLATFTNIRDGLGKNNKIFSEATRLSTDLAVATKTGPVAANVLLGKALNDPAKGLGRLTKIGVTFTDQQKAQVEQMMKVGNTAGAQKVILKELAKEFGGSAAAQATAGDKLTVAFGNLKEQIGTALLPTIDKFATFATDKAVPAISKFITGIEDGTGKGGAFAATVKTEVLPVLKNLASEAQLVFGAVKPFLGILSSLPPGLTAAAGAAGVLGKGFGSMRAPLAEGASSFSKLGRAASSAAGGAGLLAVADAANRTSPALGGLEGAIGGAVAGFSMTLNPIGALIGGVGGGLLGIFSSSKKAASGMSEAAQTASEYKDTLNDTTGAITAMTRAHAEEAVTSKKLDGVLGTYGFQHRQIVDAIVKGGPLRKRMVGDLQAEYKATNDAAQAIIDKHGTSSQEYADYVKANKVRQDAVSSALTELGAVKKATTEKYASIAANREFSKSIKNLPKNVQVQLNTVGLEPTRKAVVDLVRQFPKMSDRDIRILIKENGGKGTAANIAGIRDAAKALGKLTPTVQTKPAQRSLDDLLASVIKKAAAAKPTIVPKTDPRPASSAMSRILSALQGQADAHPIKITTKQVGDYLFGPGSTPSSPGKPKPKPAPHHNPPGPSTRESVSRVIAGNTAVADSITKVATAAKDTKKHVKKLTESMVKNQPAVKAAIDKIGRQFDRAKNKASAFKDKVSNLTDQLNALKDVKAGFVSTFSADSIFGADMETSGKSLDSLMSFASAQRDKAQQLLSDIQTSLGKGLSKSLAAQLQAAGAAGAQQLHLLASATSAQIQQFNALDAQTSAADTAGGLLLGNYVRGGSINNDIASKAADVKIAQAQLAAQNAQVKAIQHLEDRIAIALGKVGKDAGHEVAEVLGVAVKQANSKGGTHR